MAVDPKLLEILVCPVDKTPLEVVELPEAVRRRLIEKYRDQFKGEEPVVEIGLASPAAVREPRQAVMAVTAEDRETGDDVVPRLDVLDERPDLLGHRGRLVPEDDRHPRGVGALDEVQVGVTHPGGGGAEQHLAGARLGNLYVFDLQGLSKFAQDRGSHDDLPIYR